MAKRIEIPVEICRPDAVLPAYARPGDAGMDVCAAADVLLAPGETAIVPTGLKFAIPVGYEIQVRPRSGISLHTPLRLANSPGTVDSGYRGEFGVLVTNGSTVERARAEGSADAVLGVDARGGQQGTYRIRKGDRIAQIVLAEVPEIAFRVVSDVGAIGTDRKGGFGSTGTTK